ncbi:MAG: competence/damage-inducible protein A [Kordiimonadaceae bacterium]|jgi:molybdenum cofactor synthesis domain-containing protein|nr:competence/damage-inducible protein A [Kordiimonadaceae bacterium]MBT6035435.1 competence/damage-inducible protein A [Kordiimonadaceae bacterium]MBT6328382.1 competence/damage-inducible protein A [Kordiimonadaceae bacterium]MBT7583529.1 competence/damage-inducible protein A [Kordiimonadaceae bacterium]
MVKKVKAALIIIGDEILSGRTHDANLNYIAKWLGDLGIILDEVRVIPDVDKRIVDTVNECRSIFDYVFTTGGIGPTHDDITAKNVAIAFGVEFLLNEEARKLLEDNMGKGNLTEARLRMAMIPEGASLIKNPVSAAPGFQMENVFVLAGIPVVMQSMLLDVEDRISGGSKISSKAIHVFEGESVFADILAEIEDHFEHLTIGSYPFYKAGSYGATFVLRSAVPQEVDQALSILKERILEQGSEIFGGEAP